MLKVLNDVVYLQTRSEQGLGRTTIRANEPKANGLRRTGRQGKRTRYPFFRYSVVIDMIDGGTTLLTLNVTSQSFPCLRISSNIGNAHLGKSSLRKRTTESSAILFSCYFLIFIRKPSTFMTMEAFSLQQVVRRLSRFALYALCGEGAGVVLCLINPCYKNNPSVQ